MHIRQFCLVAHLKERLSVSTRNERNALHAILGNIGWPLLVGAAACSLFYACIYRGPLNLPMFHRYFATHPVAFCATGMFFVGIAALLLKAVEIATQFLGIRRLQVEEPAAAGQPVNDAERLLEELRQQPTGARQSLLGKRLRDAILFVRRKGTSDGLDDELKYLADMDAARQQDSHALVRIIIWATPMLGFLGTVVGITRALGDLDPKILATDIQLAMDGLLAGLYVAFDTTALALSLSIVLMFFQFLIDRIETQLISMVDLRTNELMVGRFQQVGSGGDPYLASVERMSNQVLRASEAIVRQQAELWEATIDAAHQRWSQLVQAAGSQTQESLSCALDRSLQTHAKALTKLERDAAERASRRWEQLQTSLSDNARMMQNQQAEMIRQGEIMSQVVKATGDVIALETTLNENLKALAGSRNFEETVMSLAAAIHLLNARLGNAGSDVNQVDLKNSESKGRAA
jgi:biopolymer transport protein ExbB/TolQ